MIANRRSNGLSHPDHKIVDRTKIRDGAVANRPICVALAVTAEGRREILGLWASDGGEDAKHWLHILTEIRSGRDRLAQDDRADLRRPSKP